MKGTVYNGRGPRANYDRPIYYDTIFDRFLRPIGKVGREKYVNSFTIENDCIQVSKRNISHVNFSFVTQLKRKFFQSEKRPSQYFNLITWYPSYFNGKIFFIHISLIYLIQVQFDRKSLARQGISLEKQTDALYLIVK